MTSNDVLNQISVTMDKFRFLKWRSDTTTISYLDKRMVEIVCLLSQIPTLTSVWSCQGHPKDGDYRGYLILAVRSDSPDTWSALFQTFGVCRSNQWDLERTMEITTLQWTFQGTVGEDYPVVNLTWKVRNQHDVNIQVDKLLRDFTTLKNKLT